MKKGGLNKEVSMQFATFYDKISILRSNFRNYLLPNSKREYPVISRILVNQVKRSSFFSHMTI